MDEMQTQDVPEESTRPRTATVVGLLIGAAATLSWLAAYAFPDALAAVELISPPAADIRPQRMALLFVVMLGLFSLLGLVMSWSSRRQLRAFDELADEDAMQ